METLLPFMVDREEYSTYVGGLQASAQKIDVSVKAGYAKDFLWGRAPAFQADHRPDLFHKYHNETKLPPPRKLLLNDRNLRHGLSR